MKARDFAAALTAFAGLTAGARADELLKFAGVFSGSKEETIAARLKRMSRATGYPATLKVSLKAIQAGLRIAGATKQATAVGAVLEAFEGLGDATVDAFIAQITAPPPTPVSKKKAPLQPDHALARQLADELTRTILDTGAFNRIVGQLSDVREVNAPTLAAVANRFLGNNKNYKGRKGAIDDIVERQRADAREDARNRALSRLGV